MITEGQQYVRFQVLWDNRPTDVEPAHGIVNVTVPSIRTRGLEVARAKRKANTIARKLRAEGKRNVSVWDTLDNPMSHLFRLG